MKAARLVIVRPVDETDHEAARAVASWVAIDSEGRRFYATTEQGAVEWLADYNHIRARAHKEQGA